MLYVTTNAHRGEPFFASIVVRLPLAGIRRGKVTAERFVWRANFNFRVAQFCDTTCYFATHLNSSAIRVFCWGETAATPTFADVSIASWEEGNYRSDGPDG